MLRGRADCSLNHRPPRWDTPPHRPHAEPAPRSEAETRSRLAATSAAGLALRRLGDQLLALFKPQALRLSILGYPRVLFAIRDVRAVTTAQDLDTVAKVADDAIGIGRLFLRHDLQGTLPCHRVTVVVLKRGEFVAGAHIGPEAADVDLQRFALGRLAQIARQFEQLKRFFERDAVQLLMRPQTGEFGLLFVVLGAELHERPEPP